MLALQVHETGLPVVCEDNGDDKFEPVTRERWAEIMAERGFSDKAMIPISIGVVEQS